EPSRTPRAARSTRRSAASLASAPSAAAAASGRLPRPARAAVSDAQGAVPGARPTPCPNALSNTRRPEASTASKRGVRLPPRSAPVAGDAEEKSRDGIAAPALAGAPTRPKHAPIPDEPVMEEPPAEGMDEQPAAPSIRGVVLDDETGKPVPVARVGAEAATTP